MKSQELNLENYFNKNLFRRASIFTFTFWHYVRNWNFKWLLTFLMQIKLDSQFLTNNRREGFRLLKFIYSEKATKFCQISTLLLSVCTVDKSKVEIWQNFVAFSEYMNFNKSHFNFEIPTKSQIHIGIPFFQAHSVLEWI